MNYMITRPVNGISLNGDERLLDSNNEVMTFDNRNDALNFIHKHNLDSEDVSVKPYSQQKHIL